MKTYRTAQDPQTSGATTFDPATTKEANMTLFADDCLDYGPTCQGKVEYRMALSATGQSFPRCAKHWDKRLDEQDRINCTYPAQAPADFDPAYAGERWDEDY